MSKVIGMLVLTAITSLYFFPIEFTFLPGVNTKMMLAALGLVMLGLRMSRRGDATIDKDFSTLSLWALGVSLAGFAAVVYNNTYDYTYATYVISMWVWCGGAYTVVSLIRALHGKASVVLVGNYLVAVCVMQCVLAMIISSNPSFEQLVNRYVAGLGFVDLETLNEAKRLYGIGASLDVAGTRFAAVLALIAYMMTHIDLEKNKWGLWLYVASIFIIGAIGNMISRTTTIGVVVCLAYLVYEVLFRMRDEASRKKLISIFIGGTVLGLGISVFLYQTDAEVRENFRFAFEGFFSLAETGKWNVHSNEILKDMFVLPDSFKTWVIGDGYMENPYHLDPYYIGPKWGGYYMATDVGYLRFIFYFGVIGLGIFCGYFIKLGQILMNRFKREHLIFFILVSLNFVFWLKVSTDIFVFYALFLMIGEQENDDYNQVCLRSEQVE